MAKSIEEHVSLRPVVIPDDEEFLRELYLESRNDLAALPISGDSVHQLLLLQYAAQTKGYIQQFPNASRDIIELDGRPAGRLIVDRQPTQFECVDISLLPQYRNSGIGTEVLKNLLDECASAEKSCVLHVLRTNRAVRLYERLGFRIIEENGTHFRMKCDDRKIKGPEQQGAV